MAYKDPEKIKAYGRKYHAEHRLACQAKTKEWKRLHPERTKELARIHASRNLALHRDEINARRREKFALDPRRTRQELWRSMELTGPVGLGSSTSRCLVSRAGSASGVTVAL